MKRRSARPFMVEVKNARTPRTALREAEPQARPDKVLWPELIQAAEPKPALPALDAAPVPGPKEPDAPARRVLPSLVPMFQNTDEAEPEPVIEPRRTRTRRERAPAVAPTVRTSKPVEPPPEIHAAAIRPDAVPAKPVPAKPIAADPAGSEQGAPPRPATWRRTKELRLGERWKRRLPPYLR